MTNKEIVAEFFTEGYVRHNYDRLMEIMAEDYYDNSPCAARSNRECVDVLKNTEKSFPDMQADILDFIEENNKVTVRVSFSGTYKGGMYDIPTRDKKITYEALEIFRMENGLIVESWGYWPDLQIKELLMEKQEAVNS